jgi:hypothetical protein
LKQFKYVFSDGSEIETADMTSAFMRELVELHGECIYNGFRDQLESLSLLRANSHKKKTDGFQPGWHPALGMEIRTNEQYQRVLKEKGMVEVGNEKRKEKKYESKVGEIVLQEAEKTGAKLSDREKDMILGKAE